ncbi:hypothetical protein C8R42DRAFT_589531, partial [Lentinula raphanica]
VLHPKYTLQYFNKAQWESTWMDTAVNILQEEWNVRYKGLINQSVDHRANTVTVIYKGLHESWTSHTCDLTCRYFAPTS